MKSLLIDLGPAANKSPSGVGQYTILLVKALTAMDKNIQLCGYFYDTPGANKRLLALFGDTVKFLPIAQWRSLSARLLRKLGVELPLNWLVKIPARTDCILFTNFVGWPYTKSIPNLLFIYDMSFIDTPTFVLSANRRYLQRFVPKSIKRASGIITISDFTKRRIEERFSLTAKLNIIVTPIPPINSKAKSQKPKWAPKKFILFVGTVEPRKNIVNLIEAYSKSKANKTHSLVLAGPFGWLSQEIKELVNKARSQGLSVITPGYVTELEKTYLYKNTSLFTLLSHYEGFGMPVLEAMKYKAPLLLSDIEVFHEVADDSAFYCNKDSISTISHALDRYIDDTSKIKLYKKQLSKFSWKENANNIYLWGLKQC
jgi:glycosyltransferase involved in cell wall biosynthesis